MGCGSSVAGSGDGFSRAATVVDTSSSKDLSNEGDKVQLELRYGQQLELGLQWQAFPGAPVIDLDASAVCLGADGQLVDAAFYNQLSACGKCILHSGDNKTGEGDGDDELIQIDVGKLPHSGSCTVILCVFAFKGGALQDMDGVNIFLRGKTKGSKKASQLAKVWLTGQSVGDGATGAAIAAVYSPDKGATWFAKRLGSPCAGTNFQEGLEDLRACAFAADVVCGVPPYATVVSMDRTFNMKKGDLAALPLGMFRSGDDVFVGLGWTCPSSLDLDASVAIKRKDGSLETVVNYQNLKYGNFVKHSGDNTTGAGSGDDEKIMIDLDTMPNQVESLWVTVNIYSEGRSFREVKDSYVRLCASSNGHELARYTLDSSVSSRGIVFCKLSTGGPTTWYMEALGLPCDGPTAHHKSVMDACGIRS